MNRRLPDPWLAPSSERRSLGRLVSGQVLGGSVLGGLVLGGLVLGGLVLAACSAEDADPVDLDRIETTQDPVTSGNPVTSGDREAADDNAESRRLAQQHAEQQCIDDPAATEGVIRIVDPETDEVVAEVIVDCVDVRASGE